MAVRIPTSGSERADESVNALRFHFRRNGPLVGGKGIAVALKNVIPIRLCLSRKGTSLHITLTARRTTLEHMPPCQRASTCIMMYVPPHASEVLNNFLFFNCVTADAIYFEVVGYGASLC